MLQILSMILFTMLANNPLIRVPWENVHLLLYRFHLYGGTNGVPYGGPDGVPSGGPDGVPYQGLDGGLDKVVYPL
jgi:hypothetical protein